MDKYQLELKRINALLRKYNRAYSQLSAQIINEIKKLYKQTNDIEKAVDMAFSNTQYNSVLEDIILNLSAENLFLGANVINVTVDTTTAVAHKLLYVPYNQDQLNLSQRLHHLSAAQKQKIKNILSNNIRTGEEMKSIARLLYDGYKTPIKNTVTAELPKYLQTLLADARNMTSMGYINVKQLQSYKKAVENIKALNQSGNTQALKSAYQELLEMIEHGNANSLNNAIMVAVNEKSRYLADRIARTESIRAYTDGFLARTLTDTAIVGYRLMTSSGHSDADICDEYVNKNIYGLGKGIYPKTNIPPVPIHPHCMCILVEIFANEIKNSKPDNSAEAQQLRNGCIHPMSRITMEDINNALK